MLREDELPHVEDLDTPSVQGSDRVRMYRPGITSFCPTVDQIVAAFSGSVISVKWFANIASLLAEPSSQWRSAVTLNSYGTDSVRSRWDRLLKSDTIASSISSNGDSILDTDDGLALAIRINQ